MSDPGVPLRGFVIVIGSAALFGMLGPLSRFAYEAGMEPPAFVAWRAMIGFLGLALLVGWRVRSGATRLIRFGDLSLRARVAMLAAALAGTVLNLCMFIAFDRITIALALLGFYTYPALVAVANVALGRERLDGARIAALLLAIGGMVAVVAAELDPGAGIRLDVVGVGLALGAAVSQTIFVILARDGYPEVPTEQAMTTVLLASGIGAFVVALLAGGVASLTQPLLDPAVLPLLVFTGIAAAAIPSLGFLTGIRLVGGTRAGILMLFEPVVGVALAALLLSEGLAWIQVLGAVAILGAALLLQRSTRSGSAVATRDEGASPVIVPGGP
ncbi:MAG TPA: DMT family transporter [Candidatus Limnocylindrales bacterium]|nr:DMT family transporter [Candidatus Limnocylindrales bacterium]